MNKTGLIAFVVGAALFLAGIPGLVESLKEWMNWLTVSEAEWKLWNVVLTAAGAIIVLLGVYPLWRRVVSGPDLKGQVLRIAQVWDSLPKSVREFLPILFFLASFPFFMAGALLVTFGPFWLFVQLLQYLGFIS